MPGAEPCQHQTQVNRRLPQGFKVFGQTGLSKPCNPRSDSGQSGQGLYYLPFRLHLLDPLLCSKPTLL